MQAEASLTPVPHGDDLLQRLASERRRATLRRTLDRFALFAVIIGVWEALVRFGWLAPLYVSQPSAIVADSWKMISTGYLFPHLGFTLYECIAGMILGTVTGMAAGFVGAISKRGSEALQPLLVAMNSMPRIAIAPLFIIWFGFGSESKIALVTLVVFFATFFNTYSGVQSVEPALVNGIRSMGGSQWDVLRLVIIPVTMAWVFAAMKTSISHALVAAVVAEFVGSQRGVGWIMTQASGTLNTPRLFAILIILAIVGSALYQIVRWAEERMLRWRPATEF